VVPVIRDLRAQASGWLSVDTTRAGVAEAALDAGADIVNDVSALRFDPALGPLVARRGAAIVLMHSRGSFDTLHHEPRYANVCGEIVGELGQALERAAQAGIARTQVILDPGLGFAKDAGHSLEALRDLDRLAALACPILVGPSRKSFIGRTLERPVEERLMGTAAAVAAAVLGGAHAVRLHDVAALRDVVRLSDALRGDA
jgi:dihydropteroate synthase